MIKYLDEKPKKRHFLNFCRWGNDDAGAVKDSLHIIFHCTNKTTELNCKQWLCPMSELFLYEGQPVLTLAQVALTEKM